MALVGVNRSVLYRLKTLNRVPALIPQRNGFFSSKKSKDEETNEKQVARKTTPQENTLSAKHNLGMLKNRVSLDTKIGYTPPPNVKGLIEKFVIPYVGEKNWETASLDDAATKYKVISKLIKEFHHDVPGSVLSQIMTVSDAIKYFETGVQETSTYEDLSKLDLPKNLHMQLEYMRFDPETDTMFNGKTAFPGSDTIVSSIKYKRKYKTIKNTKEKPGFINYYYGY